MSIDSYVHFEVWIKPLIYKYKKKIKSLESIIKVTPAKDCCSQIGQKMAFEQILTDLKNLKDDF